MTDKNRSLSPRQFRSLEPTQPSDEGGLSHSERALDRKGKETIRRQKWIGATTAHGQQVYGRIQEFAHDEMAGTTDHHFDTLERIEATGDKRKAKVMEEFTYSMLDDADYIYRKTTDTAGKLIDKTISDMGTYEVPPQNGVIKKIFGK